MLGCAKYLALIGLFTFSSAERGPEKKQITNLPGLNHEINFKQYSGYLKASEQHYLHYWFTESQKDPATSPLVLWLNGGPGCSSLGGLLEELGPFLINDDGVTVRENPSGWNTDTNLVVIESPAGVGFSYTTDFNITIGDAQVARENYAALKDFFRIFPEFRNVDLFITGESYAGVYLPMLSAEIINGQADYPVNYVGMAIGNGIVNKNMNTDTLMQFAYWHGLIDQSLWDTLVVTCCGGDAYNCKWHAANTTYCQHYVDVNNLQVWLGGLNTYDINRYCKNPGQLSGWEDNKGLLAELLGEADATSVDKQTGAETLTIDPNKLDHATIEKLVDLSSPCLNETALTNYLRRRDVRDAIGVPHFVPEYTHCSSKVGQKYKKEVFDQTPNILQAVQSGVRVLLYYGDTDMACNFLLGQQFSNSLGLPRVEAKRPWHYNNQVEGYVTRYQGLDFLTVKGVGHLVPQWKPKQSHYMIYQFINNKPY